MMVETKVKVGVIGFGFSSRTFHCPLIVSSPYLELVAVVERHGSKCQETYPSIKHVKSSDDLFVMDISLVVITTPNSSHFSLAKEAMEKGSHVIVEKPFTVTSDEAKILAEVAKKTGKICSVYQNRRWDGDFLTVAKLIQNNHLGRLVEFESHFDRFRNFSKKGWRESNDSPGSGMLYDLGAHLIDQVLSLRKLSAFSLPTGLYATIGNQRKIEGVDVTDDFTIILEYESGLRAILRSSMLARQTPVLRYSLRGMEGSFVKRHLDVQEDQLKAGLLPTNATFGVEETDRWGLLNSTINELHVVGHVETEKGSYVSYYNNVAEAIINEDPRRLSVTPEDGYNCIRLIELAEQSSKEGRTIDIRGQLLF